MTPPPPASVLPTERLLLRPLTPADWPAYHAFAADPEVQRWQIRPAHTEDALRAAFLGYLNLCALGGVNAGCGVVSGETGALVGVCMSAAAAAPPAGVAGDVVIGFLFGRPYWNRGYATESARALLGHLFGNAGARRVLAGCYAGNPGSARVLAKLGLRRLPLPPLDAVLLRTFPARRARTELWHAITAHEWRAQQGDGA